MLVSLFSSIIPLYIEKHPVEKLCKVLKMELKTYNPVNLKFVFKEIKFKVLHYIQHDFIQKCPGLSKNQTRIFESLVINYFILNYRHTFYRLYKKWQIFFLYKSRCGEWSPEIKLFIKTKTIYKTNHKIYDLTYDTT